MRYNLEDVLTDIKATEGFDVSLSGEEFEMLYSDWLLRTGKSTLDGSNAVSDAKDRFAEYLHDCLTLDLDVEIVDPDVFYVYGQTGGFSHKWKFIKKVGEGEPSSAIRDCLSEKNTRLLVLSMTYSKRIIIDGADSFRSTLN